MIWVGYSPTLYAIININYSRPLSTNWDYGKFKCGFDVYTPEDENYFIFYITQITDGTLGSNAYIINKSTNKVRFHDFLSEFTGSMK